MLAYICTIDLRDSQAILRRLAGQRRAASVVAQPFVVRLPAMATEHEDSSQSRSVFDSRLFRALFEHTRAQPRLDVVMRRPVPELEVFANEIAPAGYPVVFGDAVTPRALPWIRDALQYFHSHPLLVRVGDYASPEAYLHRSYDELTLDDYLARAFSETASGDAPAYAGNNEIDAATANALGTPPPPFYPSSSFKPGRLWLGPSGTVTPLHKDTADTFIYHVMGAKSWTLYPVRDSEHLYLRRFHDGPEQDFAVSLADLRNPDLSRFPALAQAQPIELRVDAGELLYLPMGWSHLVTSLESTLTVTYMLNCERCQPAALGGPPQVGDPG